ncbi:hypothetical protein [Thiohalophilus sp.]|uniref:hypothetical protein n=1 Tax=Thiohalophilus sp. TaxID=3028392 RepID=UPI002ACD2CFA|nr:hypothetical protein [Thiohalophilus sp.]MDZ7661153.1 hypothetical protein [Thiohalophilus sp.]
MLSLADHLTNQRIADLEGRPIAFGTRASGLRILAADILDGLGLSPEQDFEPIILDRAADGPVLVLEQNAAATERSVR